MDTAPLLLLSAAVALVSSIVTSWVNQWFTNKREAANREHTLSTMREQNEHALQAMKEQHEHERRAWLVDHRVKAYADAQVALERAHRFLLLEGKAGEDEARAIVSDLEQQKGTLSLFASDDALLALFDATMAWTDAAIAIDDGQMEQVHSHKADFARGKRDFTVMARLDVQGTKR